MDELNYKAEYCHNLGPFCHVVDNAFETMVMNNTVEYKNTIYYKGLTMDLDLFANIKACSDGS